jgi:GxxExxY protein
LLLQLFREAAMIHEEITEKILKAFFKVYNTLGFGFLEKVYENALVIELMRLGLMVTQQKDIPVYYDGITVGDYAADILVEDVIILELKAAEGIRNEHFAQLTNYLKATKKELGFVLNFGKKPEYKRMIFTNDIKQSLPAK